MRCLLLGVLSAILVFGVGTASASLTATVSPDPSAVAGTAGAIQYTLNTARRTIVCTGSSIDGTLASGAGASPLAISVNFGWSLTGCTWTGGLRPTWTCSANQRLSVTGASVSGVTPGTAGFDCVEFISASCSVRFLGRVSVTYDSLTSRLTLISPGGQSIAAAGSTCSTLPNDSSVTLAAGGGGNLVFTVSPTTALSVV